MGKDSTMLLRLVTAAYRHGIFPPRGTGRLFDKTPPGLWGGHVVTVATQAGTMTLPLRDHGVRQLLVYGRLRHEEAETRLFERLAPRMRNVIDIGANVGWYSCLLASHGIPSEARIVAVEPNPDILPCLRVNAGRHESIVVLEEAVTNNTGEVIFYSAESSDLSSSSRQVGTPTTVPATTVDAIAARYFSDPVDLVKCDVEGGEMAVLLGARKLRNSEDPPVWMLEADERFLLEMGLSYEALDEEVQSTNDCVTKYFVGVGGRWTELPRFCDLRGTTRVNVVLVPATRRSLLRSLLQDQDCPGAGDIRSTSDS